MKNLVKPKAKDMIRNHNKNTREKNVFTLMSNSHKRT